MLFTSYEFILFLIITLVLYYVVPKGIQWKLLLLSSFVFYALIDPRYLIFIIITSATSFFLACKIDNLHITQKEYLKQNKSFITSEDKKIYKFQNKNSRFRLLLLGLIINIGILGVLKYTNFTIYNINGILGIFKREPLSFVNIIVPLGISFYTFQSVGYLIDVYRGTQRAEKSFFRFTLFVSFFPQLVQGPISRFRDLSETLFSPHYFNARVVSRGLQRVLWGYFKKLVIADRILPGVTAIITDTSSYSGTYVLVGMMFYAVELYADFTGGIDITIGIAEAMGIRVAENFNRPYFSKSVKEYWKRWHITMGTWFTDYVFYPVSVSGPMLRLSRFSRAHLGENIGKRVPVYLSSFTVWLLTGIWHGASWNFVVWGLGNWLILMVSQELKPFYRLFHGRFNVKNNRIYQGFTVIRTVFIMSCLRSLDCYRDVPLTFKMLGSMFTNVNLGILVDGSLLGIGISFSDYMVLILGVVLLFVVSMVQRSGSVRDRISAYPFWAKFLIWYGLFLTVIIFGVYGVGYDGSQFIYNQF